MTTIKKVAEIAGVSFKTVSRVLNNDPNVSATTRDRVLQAIAELDYRPNLAARQMRTQQTQVIGFITDSIATTPYAGNIVKGAQDEAWHQQKLLIVINTEGDPAHERTAVDMLLERRVEGIIYAAMYHRQVSPPDNLQKVPTVLVDCFDSAQMFPSVVPDEVQGGYQATEMLLKKGHRRIALINVPMAHNAPASAGRLAGYRQALSDFGITFDEQLVVESNSFADDGHRHTVALMQVADSPTAIFCATDRLAMGCYDALKDLQRRIPDDVAVVGFDNQELIAAYLRPPLTTMALPHYEMGQWAIRFLLDHQGQDALDPIQAKLPCPPIKRQSV